MKEQSVNMGGLFEMFDCTLTDDWSLAYPLLEYQTLSLFAGTFQCPQQYQQYPIKRNLSQFTYPINGCLGKLQDTVTQRKINTNSRTTKQKTLFTPPFLKHGSRILTHTLSEKYYTTSAEQTNITIHTR
jgi:hypothetical protein